MGLSWGHPWIPRRRLILETGNQQKQLVVSQMLDLSNEDVGFVIHIYGILPRDGTICSTSTARISLSKCFAKAGLPKLIFG